jgi:hypothetical protein
MKLCGTLLRYYSALPCTGNRSLVMGLASSCQMFAKPMSHQQTVSSFKESE